MTELLRSKRLSIWRARRLFGAAVCFALVATACTGGGETEPAADETAASTPTTSAPATTVPTTTAPTTTTQPPTLDALLRELLSDDDFSATIAVDMTTRQRGLTLTSTGAGSIRGSDSELELVSDFSSLDGTFIDHAGRIVGRGGLTETSSSSVLVDGALYQRADGGRWRLDSGSLPNTTLGYVLGALATVPSFRESGTEELDGDELTVMRPSQPIDYDLRYLDIDPSLARSAGAETSILVNGDGVPFVVRVTVETDAEAGLTFESSYRLTDVGATSSVDHPPQAWVAMSSFGSGSPMFADLDVPTSWRLVNTADDAIFEFEVLEGARFAAFLVPFGEDITTEAVFDMFTESSGVEVDGVEVLEGSVFPSQLGTFSDEESNTFVMLYQQLFFGSAALLIQWVGPLDSVDEQRQRLDEVVSTVAVLNRDSGPVPGHTLANELLQTDTLALLLPAASGSEDCESPVPLWSEPISGDADSWTEEWYLGVCGPIEVFEIRYVDADGGGTDIRMTGPERTIPEDG